LSHSGAMPCNLCLELTHFPLQPHRTRFIQRFPKVLEINKSLESAPGFGADSSVSIEQNRRRSDSYGKDFATEKQMNVA